MGNDTHGKITVMNCVELNSSQMYKSKGSHSVGEMIQWPSKTKDRPL